MTEFVTIIILVVYLTMMVLTALTLRFIPKFNRLVHDAFGGPNQAVFTVLLWPVALFALSVKYGIRLMFRTINWATGNGFERTSNTYHSRAHRRW